MTAPLVIGYDGSEGFDDVLRRAASLLAARSALVVVVWEAGVAYELFALPHDVMPAPLHVATAVQVDRALYEGAQRLAQKGADMAREAGFEAEGMAVADERTVADTLVRLAEERDAAGILVGARGRGLSRLVLGSTSEGVVRRARCPVVVVRRDEGD